MSLIEKLLKADPAQRTAVFRSLPPDARDALGRQLQEYVSSPWLRYGRDPLGFVTNALGESVWSKQVEILRSVVENRRTAVPACHAPGKSHIAARIIAWWAVSHPPEKTRIVTTATTFRQVKHILWPHLRRIHMAHGLPGEMLTTEWKINGDVVADGFSPADYNETAVQGIHAENLLIVVDEAGGISNIIGAALEALMTGGNTRLLVLGNPPTDNVGSWFERACKNGLYNVIPISAYDTPNFTGEDVGPWRRNLVDQQWVDDVIRTFGEDSAFAQARVFARFPRHSANAAIPLDWIEQAQERLTPQGDIRLGVDVAANGGDEFVVAWADGLRVRIAHATRMNESPVEVAGVVLEHIARAEAVHRERNNPRRVRVKIDSIGVGWGVAGLLQEWGKEGRHKAQIVSVNVAQTAHDQEKFANQRAELWWNARELLQPDEAGEAAGALDVGALEVAQLSAPGYRSNGSGRFIIESKDDMKKRGIGSPDRAEAILLAWYEPPSAVPDPVLPLSMTQNNPWGNL